MVENLNFRECQVVQNHANSKMLVFGKITQKLSRPLKHHSKNMQIVRVSYGGSKALRKKHARSGQGWGRSKERGRGGGDREDRGEFVDAEHAAEAELLGLRALLRCLEVMRKKHVIFSYRFM